jgi:hypothetical protein
MAFRFRRMIHKNFSNLVTTLLLVVGANHSLGWSLNEYFAKGIPYDPN